MLRALVMALLLAATPALAQSTAVLRGTVEQVAADGASFTAKARDGKSATVNVTPTTRFVAVVAASLADVKPGAYVGVAAVPEGDSGLKALEVHIFPEMMRGVGEGHRAFDLAPKSTMTNGALQTRVDSVNGPQLTVTYNGGEKTIHVDDTTKIVAFTLGERSELVAGAAIIARGAKAADGAIDASAVLIGRGGVVPPM